MEFAPLEDPAITDEGERQTMDVWICSKCTRTIEPELDLCWACGTSRDGVEDPNFQLVDDGLASQADTGVDALEGDESASADGSGGKDQLSEELPVPAIKRRSRTCSDCGTKLVRIKLIDAKGRGQEEELRYAAGDAQQGGIFGYPIEGIIRAQLCPTCGRVALYALQQE